MRRPLLGRVAVAVVVAIAVAPVPARVAEADQVRDAQWHLDYLDLATAHQLTRGEGVTVAVIDSGVDATHPDLAGNVLPGIDLVDRDNDNAWTPEAHGTGVAGVIAAHGHGPDGGDGVLGVAPAATILPIRVSPDDDEQPTSHLISEAIDEAVAAGATVINISLSSGRSELDAAAVAEARRNDVVVVAAAGNRPDVETVTFPAALPGAVAVGATDRDGTHADFSVTGPELALSAPGSDIVTTGLNGEYVVASGTSVAAPMVAGAAALVRARFPDLSADEVVHRLVSTATDAGEPGWDEVYGHGIVNVVAALTADVPEFTPEDEPDETRLAQWHLETLDLAAAHELTRGEGVTVALVDTGVDATHPDLHGNVLPGIDLVDRDKDNAWTPEANGTALAGLIVGHGNRLFDHEPGNRGVLGVAPEASLLPVRAVDPDLSASENIDLAVEGIIWAATHGADVIVYASGTASRERFAPALDAVREAGAVLVSAVGDRPQISAIGYPAADESVIAVAGHDRDGALAEFSLTGPEVDIAAPAVDVTTTGLRHGYGEGSSTSVAAAIVAGATALVRARYPDLPPEEVVHRIVATATDAGPVGEDEGYGAGMLNVVEALTADVPPLPRPPDRGSPLDVSLPVAAAVLAVVVVTLLSAVFLVVGRVRARRRRRGGR
ncbi:MAG: type VII secretion-associated serine protease mycosin, partial [Micromonosporaceae bacterium]